MNNATATDEFSKRMAALTPDEQRVAAMYIADEIMFAELANRQKKLRNIITEIEKAVSGIM